MTHPPLSWVAQELGTASLALDRRLTAAFDPHGTLNPHTWLAESAPASQDAALTAAPLTGRNNS